MEKVSLSYQHPWLPKKINQMFTGNPGQKRIFHTSYQEHLYYTYIMKVAFSQVIKGHTYSYKICYAHFFSFRQSACPLSPYFALRLSTGLSIKACSAILPLTYEFLESIYFGSTFGRQNYCGPKMDPGLAILHHPMNDSAGILYCYIAQIPIRVPVLPRPALQWMAIAPLLVAK